MLIKRGADLPLLLIFAGVIGGMLGFGLIGIFVGPVVLAVTYTLLEAWIEDGLGKAEAQASSRDHPAPGGGPMDMVEPFVALVIYPTTPDAQSRQADNLARIASEKIRAVARLPARRVFVSEDGESLVTLTEWSDRESFLRFRQSEFGQAAIRLAADLRPQAHWLRQHATVEAPWISAPRATHSAGTGGAEACAARRATGRSSRLRRESTPPEGV